MPTDPKSVGLKLRTPVERHDGQNRAVVKRLLAVANAVCPERLEKREI
jgi:hypothetical protein